MADQRPSFHCLKPSHRTCWMSPGGGKSKGKGPRGKELLNVEAQRAATGHTIFATATKTHPSSSESPFRDESEAFVDRRADSFTLERLFHVSLLPNWRVCRASNSH